LAFYGLVLVHDVLPHVHFDHHKEKASHTEKHHEHHHSGNHHHGETTDDFLGVLLDWMGDHAHPDIRTDHFDDYTSRGITKADDNVSFEFFAYAGVVTDIGLPLMKISVLREEPPPIQYKSPNLLFGPLRGPPVAS